MERKEADVGELQKRLLGMQAVIVGVLPSGPNSWRVGASWNSVVVLRLTETPVVCSSEQLQENTSQISQLSSAHAN